MADPARSPGRTPPETANSHRRVVESLSAFGIVTMDLSRTVTSWSRGAERIFGWTTDEMVGRKADAIFLPDDLEAGIPKREMDTALALGKASDDRYHATKSGKAVFSVGMMFPILGDDGKAMGLVKCVTDGTEQRERDQAAKAAADRLRRVVDSLPCLVCMFDARETFLFNNRTYESWYLRPIEQITGRTIRDLFGETAYENVRPYIKAALGGKSVEYETHVPADGKPGRWIRASYVPMHGPDGQVVGAMGLTLDITADKNAHEDLRTANLALSGEVETRGRSLSASEERRAQLGAMLDLAHDAVIMTDSDHRVLYWNRGAAETYGWTAAEAEGRATQEFLEPEYPEPLDVIRKRLETSGYWEGEMIQRHRDGRRLVVASRWALHRREAGGVFVLKINRDVTAQRRAFQELERSNRDLEQFARFAAHDLQEPLRAIAAHAERLRRETCAKDDAAANGRVEAIIGAALRIKGLIDDLLAYSSAREADGREEPVDLGEILPAAAAEACRQVGRSTDVVRLGPLPPVLGRRAALAEAFRHLIANALTFHKPGRAPEVEVTAERAGNAWRVRVADKGIGIDPAYHERVFEPFRRLHPKDEYPGSGLGLATARRIVRGMGGDIGVESRLGQGAVFVVTLRAAG